MPPRDSVRKEGKKVISTRPRRRQEETQIRIFGSTLETGAPRNLPSLPWRQSSQSPRSIHYGRVHPIPSGWWPLSEQLVDSAKPRVLLGATSHVMQNHQLRALDCSNWGRSALPLWPRRAPIKSQFRLIFVGKLRLSVIPVRIHGFQGAKSR